MRNISKRMRGKGRAVILLRKNKLLVMFFAKRLHAIGIDIERIWYYNQDAQWKPILQQLLDISKKHGIILGCPDFVNTGPEWRETRNTCCGVQVPNPCTYNTHHWKHFAQGGKMTADQVDQSPAGVVASNAHAPEVLLGRRRVGGQRFIHVPLVPCDERFNLVQPVFLERTDNPLLWAGPTEEVAQGFPESLRACRMGAHGLILAQWPRPFQGGPVFRSASGRKREVGHKNAWCPCSNHKALYALSVGRTGNPLNLLGKATNVLTCDCRPITWPTPCLAR